MSEVYIKEPPTNGKAIFRTTHGDLEMELWATEAPKACRNFCQLILEGYYNNTIFHRVIKDFIVQGGAEANNADSSESIYGKSYPDEIHPRLKFRYRGMMGVASAGKNTNTNGSQFFVVLNRTPSLDGKHTLFGKVVGQTVYNLVRLTDVEVDKSDRPIDPPRIIRAELVWDPFGDLEPRRLPEPPKVAPTKQLHTRAPVKAKNKLSFVASDDEDDSEGDGGKAAPSAKGKSAHDLLADPKLLKEAAYPQAARAARGGGGAKRAVTGDDRARSEVGGGSTQQAKGKTLSTAKAIASPGESSDSDSGADWANSHSEDEPAEDSKAQAKSQRRQEDILRLKREIANVKPDALEEKKSKHRGSALEEMRAGYKSREPRVQAKGKEGKRQEQADMLSRLQQFRSRIHGVIADAEAETTLEKTAAAEERTKADNGTFAAIWAEGDEAADEDWLGGNGLKFHVSADKAFKLDRDKAMNTLEIFDPLAAGGNSEVLADARKRFSEKMIPLKRRKPEKKTQGDDEDEKGGKGKGRR